MAKKAFDSKFWVAAALVACAALYMVRLGYWQLDRLIWKENLIAEIEEQAAVDPMKVPLAKLVESFDKNLQRGYLKGMWMQDKNAKVGPQMMDGQLGYWIVTPFHLNDGSDVMVVRGWVPETMVALMLSSQPQAGLVTLTGSLRLTEESDGPVGGDNRSWHKLDVQGIAGGLGVGEKAAKMALFMERSEPADETTFRPVKPTAELRNEHWNYAIFWFGMVGVLLVVFYIAAVHPRLNLPKKR